jgi:hypothetical protein
MKELFSALCKAQSQIRGAVKDSRNPHFNSMFANLESVVEAIRQPLADNSLCFTQSVFDGHVHTTIWHSSGEHTVSLVPFLGKMDNMQQVGAALTYARRQGLCTAFGVPQVNDDDGEECAGRYNPPVVAPKPVAKPAPVAPVATPKTDKISADLAKELGTPAELIAPIRFSRENAKHVAAVKAALYAAQIPAETVKRLKPDFEQYLATETYLDFNEAVFNFFSARK